MFTLEVCPSEKCKQALWRRFFSEIYAKAGQCNNHASMYMRIVAQSSIGYDLLQLSFRFGSDRFLYHDARKQRSHRLRYDTTRAAPQSCDCVTFWELINVAKEDIKVFCRS